VRLFPRYSGSKWPTAEMELLVEREKAGDDDILGENLCQCHFVHHMTEIENDCRGGKPATNCLSYATAQYDPYHT
jgi:hypothetical protein